MQPSYEVRRGSVDHDAQSMIQVWRGHLGEPKRMEAKFQWFYRGCPYGQPLVLLLHSLPTDAVVGVGAAGRRRMRLGARELSAGVLVDLAVATEHRSLFPALLLQKTMKALGLEAFDLLYGFPNPKAAAVFQRTGYDRLAHITRYVRVLRSAPYLARRMPGFLARIAGGAADFALAIARRASSQSARGLDSEWVISADARMDELWSAHLPRNALVAVRDLAFLKWRFDSAPSNRFRYFCVSGGRGKQLVAWFVCEALGDTLHVRDFWTIDSDTDLQRRFLELLSRAALYGGYASLSIEYFGSARITAALTAAGFRPRGSRPVFSACSEQLRAAGGIAVWHLTSADEDE
jgi:hypothetical protein